MGEAVYNSFVYDLSEEDSKDNNISGYIYDKEGHFLEHRGSSESVYLAKVAYRSEGKSATIHYEYPLGLIDLKIEHNDFTFISFVIMKEGKTELELRCIAFASHNHSIKLKRDWKGLLNSSYSSVPTKTNLRDDNKTVWADLARKSVISVLKGDRDITDGAEYWDGTDFLMLGDSEKKWDNNKIGSNKFDEYKFVEIRHDLYDQYLKAQNASSVVFSCNRRHRLDNEKGQSHEHVTIKKNGKEIQKIRYKIPAQEFNNPLYRTCTGDFYYDRNPTGRKCIWGISATIVAGKSIFWKKTKVRCTSGTVGNCTNPDCKVHSRKH